MEAPFDPLSGSAMRKHLAVVLTALSLLPAGCTAQNQGLDAAAAKITPEDYAWRVGVIAHDSMQGRNTPSEGLDKTARWIASELEGLGLRGGAPEGGFIQRYPLVRTVLDADASGLRAKGARLTFGQDLLPFRSPTDGEVTGGLVLASGISGDAAIDSAAVAGKHVAIVLPESVSSSRRSRFALLGAVSRAGAASVLLVDEEPDATWATDAARSLRPSVGLPEDVGDPPPSAPMLRIRAASLDRLLAGTGLSVAGMKAQGSAVRLQEVPGLSLSLVMRVHRDETSAPNVVAVLEGSDPVLKDEYVVFSGHMDHVGMGAPDQNGDSIYNGADDDASGTVGVMEVARAMSAMPTPPRRSDDLPAGEWRGEGALGERVLRRSPHGPGGPPGGGSEHGHDRAELAGHDRGHRQGALGPGGDPQHRESGAP